MIKRLFLLLVLVGCELTEPSLQVRVHTVNELPNTDTVFITGVGDRLGNWNGKGQAMKRVGPNDWEYTYDAPRGGNMEFKITLGSWDREALDSNRAVFENIDMVAPQIIELTIHDFGFRTVPKSVVGQIDHYISVADSADRILARDIDVWLPPGYRSDSIRYPVIYMHEGKNLFDATDAGLGMEWELDESLDSLIRGKYIGPIIVVGIAQTPDRMDEYTPGKKGKAYMDFVVNTVKPMIDSMYRTKPEREYTYTGGASAGGTISAMLGMHYPDVFKGVLCFSPALKIEDIDLVKELTTMTPRNEVIYYLDCGGLGVDSRLLIGTVEFARILRKQHAYVEGQDYILIKDLQADHNELAWAKRFPFAIQWLTMPRWIED